MATERALLEALTAFATRSVEDYDITMVLDEVGERACAVLDLDGAGITLKVRHQDEETKYMSATDMSTFRVESAQDDLREGPCVDAINTGQAVTAPDVEAFADRWPRYTPVVLEAGFRRVAGVPMLAGGRVIGALNAYRSSPGEWAPDDVHGATLFANVATAFIANASAYSDKAVLADQLQRALDSRVIIEQAKGVLAERNGISLADAFEVMRRHARDQRTKLADVAADVLSGRQAFRSEA